MSKNYYETIYELTCPICGKIFVPATEHVYRTGDRRPVCSWTCLCKYRRDIAIGNSIGPVRQYSKNGERLALFANASAAGRVLGIDAQTIRKCCRGDLKSAGGFVWKWEAKDER